MEVKIKRLCDEASIPQYAHATDAGMDLVATSYEYNEELHCHVYGTGIAVEIPEGYFGALFARSGIASKRGLRPANCVGVIDSDYRGEIKVAIINDSTYVQKIEPQERIAQLVILPYKSVELEQVDELDKTERGEGGFGSTGTN